MRNEEKAVKYDEYVAKIEHHQRCISKLNSDNIFEKPKDVLNQIAEHKEKIKEFIVKTQNLF